MPHSNIVNPEAIDPAANFHSIFGQYSNLGRGEVEIYHVTLLGTEKYRSCSIHGKYER